MSSTFSVLFLGSGVSTAIPNMSHILYCNNGSSEVTDADLLYPTNCEVCMEAMTNNNSRNRRNNVSIALIFDGENAQRVIVIDVGKTMREAFMKIFPRHGLKKIDSIMWD